MFLEKLIRELKTMEEFIFSKKHFKTLARIKRSCTFAPANRKNGEINKEDYVPRHIELTAVPKEISEHK